MRFIRPIITCSNCGFKEKRAIPVTLGAGAMFWQPFFCTICQKWFEQFVP